MALKPSIILNSEQLKFQNLSGEVEDYHEHTLRMMVSDILVYRSNLLEIGSSLNIAVDPYIIAQIIDRLIKMRYICLSAGTEAQNLESICPITASIATTDGKNVSIDATITGSLSAKALVPDKLYPFTTDVNRLRPELKHAVELHLTNLLRTTEHNISTFQYPRVSERTFTLSANALYRSKYYSAQLPELRDEVYSVIRKALTTYPVLLEILHLMHTNYNFSFSILNFILEVGLVLTGKRSGEILLKRAPSDSENDYQFIGIQRGDRYTEIEALPLLAYPWC